MKKIIILSLLIIIPLFLIACAQTEQKTESGILFFVSEGCGHCAKVKQYIKDNNINSRVEYEEIEAYETEENYALFNAKATECGIPENQRGVPLVYENGTCALGDVDAISFFANKVK